MFRLATRAYEDGIAHHQKNPIRVYSEDPIQKDRIERSRKALDYAIAGRKDLQIVELGCGTGDITGPYAEKHRVVGVECSPLTADKAKERFPYMSVWRHALETYHAIDSDILVLCETLEHINEPAAIVKNWGRKAGHMVISHPLNEKMGSDISGGDHCWSFDYADYLDWFNMAGHTVIKTNIFQMGKYEIILGVGQRA